MACNLRDPYDTETLNCGCKEVNETPNLGLAVKDLSRENPVLQTSFDRSTKAYTKAIERCDNTIESISSLADKNQRKNTKGLEERAKEISHWKGETKALISKLRDEIKLLDNMRKQVERALTALQVPEAINFECQSRRTCRTGYDMVCDQVDASLLKEEKLCQEIRELLNLLKAEIVSQLKTNIVCKQQLEFDWSDKKEAYKIEAINIGLKADGPTAFYPGAVRLSSNQCTPEHWLHYTKELNRQGNEVLERSQSLRARAQESLTKAAADLRAQANEVHLEFDKVIAITVQALQAAEQKLTQILGEITVAETLHAKLENLARQVDMNIKVSQTRLHHRLHRPRAEQTRDAVQQGLIEEVSQLNEDACCIKQEMDNVEKTLQLLYNTRAILENTIAVKRKSLYIDRDRCLPQRNKFPDSIVLAGF